MKQSFCQLKTPFEENPQASWQSEYPRPQLKRDSFVSLCGEWDLFVCAKDGEQHLGKIPVPFVPESRLSGIERLLKKGERYRYTNTFHYDAAWQNQRVLLHFGAVDQIACVYMNGTVVGEHVGGYLSFTFDVTDYLTDGENTLWVEVTDELNLNIPYGKQRHKRGGMWYTPISGIWQSVWLEWVPTNYIRSLRITPTTTSVTIETEGGRPQKRLTLADGTSYCYEGDSVTIIPEHPHLWSPEDPYLYDFTLTDGEDILSSYFALRTVSSEIINGKPTLCLNHKPYFFHGLLDQGYFSDGIYLPATPEGYRSDIQTAKSLGFNTLRKHIKVEPDLFYYHCDRYGMIVFQDMVNSGKYHFLWDTALPTVGLKHLPKSKPRSCRKAQFETDCQRTIRQLYNHPCVCYYTIFNEGWGQYNADGLYRMCKSEDASRIWDATSGWFFGKESDVQSEHVYFRPIRLKSDGRPLVLSEFGGYACKISDHVYNRSKDYGYKTCQSAEALQRDLSALYREQVIPSVKQGLCAAILTQISDVEDEINGLVTYDRQIVKVDSDVMQQLAQELFEAHQKTWC